MQVTVPRMFPPLLTLLCAGLMVAVHALLPLARVVPAPLNQSGWALIAAAVLINLSAARTFRRRGTPISPVAAPQTVATDGVYGISRNPMYMGMLLALIGVAVLLGSLAPLPVPALFAWYVDRRFIAREEAVLAQRFGGDYADYRSRVRRWL